jgi:hypothetical protein
LELPKRNKKGLTTSEISFIPMPSSLGRSVFSLSINEGKMPAWNVVSAKPFGKLSPYDEVMYTALEYPSSEPYFKSCMVVLMVLSGRLSPLFLYDMAGNRLLSFLANPFFPFYSRRL